MYCPVFRDRAPFVLTHDMVYVINGGERPTQRFHHFVELCCMAFNIVRSHHDHILDLFALVCLAPSCTYYLFVFETGLIELLLQAKIKVIKVRN